MALNLSTLTSPTTSGDVLAEMLTTADFLDSVPVLRNIARGSNKGGDAKQTTALNQPKALPVIDGKGYLYLSGVNGNRATLSETILPATGDFDLNIDFVWKDTGISAQDLFGQYTPSIAGRFFIYVSPDGALNTFWNGGSDHQSGAANSIIDGRRHVARFNRTGNTFTVYLDGVSQYSYTVGSTVPILQVDSTLGFAGSRTLHTFKGAIFSVTEGSNTNIDFTATSIPHGAKKFQCATGQTVTINQSGNDPATIIKRSVLRFDGGNDGLQGLFGQTITEGYMFAAFSVLGDGGESYGRVFSVHNSASGFDHTGKGIIFSIRDLSNNDLGSYYTTFFASKDDLFDDANGDILHQVRIKSGEHLVSVNNTTAISDSRDTSSVDSDTFNIGCSRFSDASNAAIDLYWLGLFPATISPAEAARVVTYINNRNHVFDLKDGFGHYFYDATKAPVGAISSGSASWNGRIVGSDNGDADKYATQATASNQPVSDGYKVTFADNTDFLTIPSTTQAGWQVVGTSLGTFAYRVNANAVTELNLLGNFGSAFYRKAGQSYGMILLPESATGADIESARRLLIDRGSLDGSLASAYFANWNRRHDIVEFHSVDLSNATNVSSAWDNCSSLTTFPALNLSGATNISYSWYNCLSLSDFRTTDIKNGNNFSNAWQNCSALTSFPAGAQLGTAATNVNFTSAWEASGLTSFSTPLPTAEILYRAWYNCSSLTSFSSDLSSAVDIRFAWRDSGLTSFSTPLPKAGNMFIAWYGCSSLTDFSSDVFANWNPGSIASGVFNIAWDGCTSLTAQSVENILTSIDVSGHYATTNKVSGGSALADAGIDIDYNVATGALSAATNTAIRSLSGKGWQVFINGEIRTGVGLLDTSSYYFFESEGLPVASVATWDSSVSSSSASLDLVGAQTTGPDQPVADGTLVTFADNTDHLDIPSTTQAGWQVAGTSLGTFAYKVNANAVTELNLLGNAGGVRTVGDLYGTILLPETATGADIEETRQALIARGSADATTSTSLYAYWNTRADMVEFKSVDTSSATNFMSAWENCTSLTSFPFIDTSSGTNFIYSWSGCTSLTSFPALDMSSGTDFSIAWRNCTSLTSIPAGIQLGTAATGVSFSNAFQNSGLTEIPANLDLSQGDYFQSSFQDCSSLTSIGTSVLFGTASTGVNFKYTWKNCTNLVTLPADFNLSAGTDFTMAFQNCTSLVDFPAGVFDTMGVPVSNCFAHTWTGCTALSTTSVENILSSIDTSGQSSPAGGGHIIILNYNVSTGALTAATNTAVTSLKSKGWGVVVNNVTL